MFTFLLVLQFVICLTLIGLVLVQQGKGADAGAAFGSGGGANTFFGAAGAADFMTKATTFMAIAFMACSILLVRGYQEAGVQTLTTDVNPVAGSKLLDVAPTQPEAPADAAENAAMPSTEEPAAGEGEANAAMPAANGVAETSSDEVGDSAAAVAVAGGAPEAESFEEQGASADSGEASKNTGSE